jgi:glucan endo-1,3-beta-D-glucosidase
VDTWTAWVNGSNTDVISNCDWLGFDGYPYWQTTDDNTIENGKALFLESYNKVTAIAGSKEVWVTETGWAVTDKKGGEGKALANTADAKTYWDDVGCGYLFGNINTYWYMLSDASSSPSFGISSSDSNTTPLFDLSCSK